MPKPKKPNFLTLPRELRQQILAETFNLKVCCPEPIMSAAQRDVVTRMLLSWKKIRNTGWVDTADCIAALNGIESWIGNLKRVHSGFVEDVEYVARKDEMLALLRQFTRDV